jgi:hypothetical protein
MPSQPRRKRTKQSAARKARIRQQPPAAVPASAPPDVSPEAAPVSAPSRPLSRPGTPRHEPAPSPILHPYIASELRTIGVLAVVLVVILAGLYVVL